MLSVYRHTAFPHLHTLSFLPSTYPFSLIDFFQMAPSRVVLRRFSKSDESGNLPRSPTNLFPLEIWDRILSDPVLSFADRKRCNIACSYFSKILRSRLFRSLATPPIPRRSPRHPASIDDPYYQGLHSISQDEKTRKVVKSLLVKTRELPQVWSDLDACMVSLVHKFPDLPFEEGVILTKRLYSYAEIMSLSTRHERRESFSSVERLSIDPIWTSLQFFQNLTSFTALHVQITPDVVRRLSLLQYLDTLRLEHCTSSADQHISQPLRSLRLKSLSFLYCDFRPTDHALQSGGWFREMLSLDSLEQFTALIPDLDMSLALMQPLARYYFPILKLLILPENTVTLRFLPFILRNSLALQDLRLVENPGMTHGTPLNMGDTIKKVKAFLRKLRIRAFSGPLELASTLALDYVRRIRITSKVVFNGTEPPYNLKCLLRDCSQVEELAFSDCDSLDIVRLCPNFSDGLDNLRSLYLNLSLSPPWAHNLNSRRRFIDKLREYLTDGNIPHSMYCGTLHIDIHHLRVEIPTVLEPEDDIATFNDLLTTETRSGYPLDRQIKIQIRHFYPQSSSMLLLSQPIDDNILLPIVYMPCPPSPMWVDDGNAVTVSQSQQKGEKMKDDPDYSGCYPSPPNIDLSSWDDETRQSEVPWPMTPAYITDDTSLEDPDLMML
ncbi:hypothetical protein ABKN59_011352 [Abortiporus biennis]